MKSHLAVNSFLRLNRSSNLRFAVILHATAVVNLAGAGVQLYLEPDIRSQKLEVLEAGDPLLVNGQPATDPAKAVLGWQQVEKITSVRGFVPDAEIGKDLLPVDGTPLHKMADSESATYGFYRDGMSSRILDRGMWWSIEVEMPITAFFLPAMPAIVKEGTGGESTVENAPVALFQVSENEPSPQVSNPPVASLQESTPNVSRPNLEPVNSSQTQLLQGVMSQRFEGTFRKSRGFLGIRTPTYPYYLEGRTGARLAWIDTETMIYTGALEDYIGQKVIVFGEMDPDASAAKRTISARNMR